MVAHSISEASKKRELTCFVTRLRSPRPPAPPPSFRLITYLHACRRSHHPLGSRPLPPPVPVRCRQPATHLLQFLRARRAVSASPKMHSECLVVASPSQHPDSPRRRRHRRHWHRSRAFLFDSRGGSEHAERAKFAACVVFLPVKYVRTYFAGFARCAFSGELAVRGGGEGGVCAASRPGHYIHSPLS